LGDGKEDVMSDPASLARIGQIHVNAHDLDRAAAFYRDALGLKELFRVPKMAFFDCGGIRLMLGIPEKPEFDHPSSVLYFEVADIEAAHRALAGRGVRFEAGPHFVAPLGARDLWMAFFRDTEGNLMALQSERPRA
jgi:predicted enzyme related to lactoylglutathione lyase